MPTMNEFSGLLPVFKPTGMSSRDASRVLIRRHGKFKFGHVGTLDPDADGVLPVLIGSATKLQDYLLNMPKAYRFVVKLGDATTTLDASGDVTASMSWDHVTRDAIEQGLQSFLGEIQQVPPLFSAVKLNGQELYKHARKGQAALSDDERRKLARTVTVHSIELLNVALPEIEIRVTCSKGTYIRTIADDLARLLGTAGHVVFLRRELSAGFAIDKCFSLDELTAENAEISRFLIPTEQIAIGLPVWRPSDMLLTQRLLNGQHLKHPLARFESESTDSPKFIPGEVPRSVLVRDQNGESVGIGEVTYEFERQQVMIHLKRGL